jgi:hypothetical protein
MRQHLLIAGSRSIEDPDATAMVWQGMQRMRESGMLDFKRLTTVLTGGARGIDQAGELVARGLGIRVVVLRPDYQSYPGEIAPLKRNEELAWCCNIALLIRVKDGPSNGTDHVHRVLHDLGRPHRLEFYDATKGAILVTVDHQPAATPRAPVPGEHLE